MTVINVQGENSLYRNAVKNCVQVLKDHFTPETGRTVKQYYDEDIYLPKTPSIAVLAVGSDDELRSVQNMSQMRYTINIGLEVWYYHADLTEEVKRNEITYILWEINFLLKKYVTLNGFVPKLGIEVSGARWVPVSRGDRIYAAGVISLVAKKLHTATTVL